MLNLVKYLNIDPQIHRFKLPISMRGSIFLEIFKLIVKPNSFFSRLYVDTRFQFNFYFDSVFGYVNSKIKIDVGDLVSQDSLLPLGYKFYVNQVEINEDLYTKVKGYGHSLSSSDEAKSKALGEFLERFASSNISSQAAKNFKDMKIFDFLQNTDNIFKYHSYLKEQTSKFEYLFLNKEGTVKCAEVENILDKKKYFYPIQQIFWNQKKLENEGGYFAMSTTSGCAGGFSKEEAILNAVYELVERDSFLCFWQTKSTPKKLFLQVGLMSEIDRIISYANTLGYDLHILDTTTDLAVPSVTTLLFSKNSKGVIVSGCARSNIVDAIYGAVTELYACMPSLFSEKEFVLDKNYLPFLTEGIYREERINYWAKKLVTNELDFLLTGESKNISSDSPEFMEYQKTPRISPQKELENILDSLLKGSNSNIQSIFMYEFKDTILDKLGFFVCRIIIPYLYPLYLSEHTALPVSKRLEDFNLWKNGSREFNINTSPHPYP